MANRNETDRELAQAEKYLRAASKGDRTLYVTITDSVGGHGYPVQALFHHISGDGDNFHVQTWDKEYKGLPSTSEQLSMNDAQAKLATYLHVKNKVKLVAYR